MTYPLLLLCALTLPPMTKDKEYRMLRRMMARYYPNTEIILLDPKIIVSGPLMLHTPLTFKGLKVYLKKSA